jgi:aryl-alcohol dehydrogenase-like predicted oxidoreductase
MRYVNLGRTGLQVSRLAFGCSSYGSKDWMPWALSEDDAQAHYRKAFEAGFNFFDTAESYSSGQSEAILGRALKRFGPARDRVVIATKIGLPEPYAHGLSRKRIRHAVDDSLRRLGTDYIDLYQVHRLDTQTPPEELLRGLDDVVRAGKVLFTGASSMHAWQFCKLQHLAVQNSLTPFATMQNKYNLLYREEEREMLPLCLDQDVAVLPYSPLARGLLAGSRRQGTERSKVVRDFSRPEDERVVDRVIQVADARGLKPSQVALAWLLKNPVVTAPIVGVTQPHHLDDAIDALDVELTSDEIDLLEEVYVPQQAQFHRNASPMPGQTAAVDLLPWFRR